MKIFEALVKTPFKNIQDTTVHVLIMLLPFVQIKLSVEKSARRDTRILCGWNLTAICALSVQHPRNLVTQMPCAYR